VGYTEVLTGIVPFPYPPLALANLTYMHIRIRKLSSKICSKDQVEICETESWLNPTNCIPFAANAVEYNVHIWLWSVTLNKNHGETGSATGK